MIHSPHSTGHHITGRCTRITAALPAHVTSREEPRRLPPHLAIFRPISDIARHRAYPYNSPLAAPSLDLRPLCPPPTRPPFRMRRGPAVPPPRPTTPLVGADSPRPSGRLLAVRPHPPSARAPSGAPPLTSPAQPVARQHPARSSGLPAELNSASSPDHCSRPWSPSLF